MSNTMVIRPITDKDIGTLVNVARNVGPGFTSLPNDKSYLEKKVHRSIDSFAQINNIPERLFLFIMENSETKEFAGMCGIESNVGYEAPFYDFKVSTITQVCESINKYLEHSVLQLVNDFQHSSELVSLFLHPDFRGERRGEFLSRSRLLFIAEFSEWFSDIIFAEIRGMSDAKGYSPLWEALGRSFFDMDFIEADFMTTISGKQFIADLMPTYPIYLDLLPKEARNVIGVAHPQAARAKNILEKEGFNYRNYVDIFDGGPLIEAFKNSIKSIASSKKSKVKVVDKVNATDDNLCMISNASIEFRLTLANIAINNNDEVEIDSITAESLMVSDNDEVRYCRF